MTTTIKGMSLLNTTLRIITLIMHIISRPMISSIRTQMTHALAQMHRNFHVNQLQATLTLWTISALVSHTSTNT